MTIWLLVLQPAVSSAQLAQSPMFTVTSAPPNVMLMFDDSASMNRLDLNPPPAYASPTVFSAAPGNHAYPMLNTVGYFGISGIRWYYSNSYFDGRWQFETSDVLTRAPAFNPLAYNPAVQYLPWNRDGVRFPNSSMGGAGNPAAGSRTEWDPRNLPPSMAPGFPAVATFLTAPNQGVIHTGGEVRSFTASRAGSIAYLGIPEYNLAASIGNPAPSGADLFSSTVAFDNPNCGSTFFPTLYTWWCPPTAGGAFASPAEACAAPGDLGPSDNGRTCCNFVVDSPTSAVETDYVCGFRDQPDPGPPVPGFGLPAGGTWVTGNFTTGATSSRVGTCTVTSDDPPYEIPCPPGVEGQCFYDPPPVESCTSVPTYQWCRGYEHTVITHHYSCPPANESPQQCVDYLGPETCAGPAALSTTSDARLVSGHFTPARYVMYDGPQPGTADERRELTNYRVIMIDRAFGWNGTTQVPTGTNPSNAVGKYYVVDPVSGLPAPAGVRPDCPQTDAYGAWCTFAQEAQNYANWFTYYRNRMFAAIGVISEVATGMVGPEQFMRMGYGRINYFPNARNPWNFQSFSDPEQLTWPTVDGVANLGGVERGVRPFTRFDPPLSATPNPDRAAVFNWLFTIAGLGPTPNREALHGAGKYFSRTDSRGPWGAFPGSGSEPISEHLWCRRNYTLLATDGEWTRLDTTPQPLLERPPLVSTRNPFPGPGSVSVSMSVTAPNITDHIDRDTGFMLPDYQYVPGSEPQIAGGYGSTDTETLTDVLHYYWSRDLRDDLRNSIKTTTRNRAWWQHMTAFVVGYGVNASMDDPAAATPLRSVFDARNLISWPQVGLEDCRQLDNNAADSAIGGCAAGTHTVTPEGNRINDVLRGALTSGGDFFSATSPAALKSSLESVFAAIGSDPAAGTAPGLSSSTVGAGNLVVQSGFFTNVWEGFVRAYDQAALVTFLTSGGTAPPEVWSFKHLPPASRPIFSSVGITSPIPFEWGSLVASQQAALGSSLVLDYLRGDQSNELRFPGGQFRNRPNTILGDIVQSTPLYSKGADQGYSRRPAGSVVLPAGATQGNTLYGAYVTAKRTTRTEIAIFGANDGMLHILDARVGQATSGREVFAYVPRSLYSTLSDLKSPAYSHRFYVDGPVVEGDVFNGTAWRTMAVGTTGAGAAGIFAIDITSPESGFSASNLLWDIVPAEHADPAVVSDLGNVLQPAIIGSVKNNAAGNGAGQWVVMVPNGYDSVSKQATLFVFNAFNGNLIKALQTGVGSAATPNGLGGITPVFDGNRNIIAVYGGDKLGNMWKFDFTSPFINDPDGAGPQKGWEIYNKVAGLPAPLFVATDSGGTPQPITAPPRITPHGISGLHVGFGTGKLFEAGDQISLQEQAIYVVWDKGQIPTIPKTSLQQISLQNAPWDHDSDIATAPVADGTFRQLKAADLASYDWTQEGFFVPLKLEFGPNQGERILAAGFLDAGVLSFTSFQQQSGGVDLCVPGGTSHVYRFNLIGGLGEAGFLGVTGPVVGRRIQPGLVSAAPPIYEPLAVAGGTVDAMSAADVTDMLKNPKYRLQSGRAVEQGPGGTCAHIGLKVDGTVARIPTACAGLVPLRTWRPIR